jgi:Protein of unknown function (DUF3108)
MRMRSLAWLAAAALAWPVGAAARPPQPAPPAAAAPLLAHYEAYALGFPAVSFDFRLAESAAAYTIDGTVRTEGLLRLFYRFDMLTDSAGAIGAGTLLPRFHEQRLRIRGRGRRARLVYPGDGSVATSLVPPADAGRPRPTPRQIVDTLDPFSAILAIGRAVAQSGRCGGRFPVYDGRRRYDLVLADDGAERLEKSSAYGYAGIVRRCSVGAVKIAGFSWDQDYSPHTSRGRVWFAVPRPGAPALPVRIEFGSSWGFVSVRLVSVGDK